MMPSICKEAKTRYRLPFSFASSSRRYQQDYGFDYSDNDEANESGSADVENMYYTAKCASHSLLLLS